MFVALFSVTWCGCLALVDFDERRLPPETSDAASRDDALESDAGDDVPRVSPRGPLLGMRATTTELRRDLPFGPLGDAAFAPVDDDAEAPVDVPAADDVEDAAGDAAVDVGDGAPTPLPPLGPGVVTLAGGPMHGAVDGAREAARLWNPVNVARGPDGLLYVADYDSGLLRVLDLEGRVRTLTRQSNFGHPFGIAFAADGRLYVETDSNDRGLWTNDTGTLWRIARDGRATMLVRDVGRPRGLVPLPDGRIVTVDSEHHVVQVFNPATLTLTVLAGERDRAGYLDAAGRAARFRNPGDAVLLGDRIVLADRGNHRLRAVSLEGVVTTWAGTGEAATLDGTRLSARFHEPQGLAVDASGAVFVSELGGHVLRRIGGDGRVQIVAGSGMAGAYDSSDPLQASFFGLEGLDVSDDGAALYVADGNRGSDMPFHRVRRVLLPAP